MIDKNRIRNQNVGLYIELDEIINNMVSNMSKSNPLVKACFFI